MGNPYNLLKDKEDILQFQCVSWFHFVFKEKEIFHVPNGGMRHPAVAAKLKLIGTKAGVLDLFILEPIAGWHGLIIELKVKPNKPNKTQLDFINRMEARGYFVRVCYTFEEFKKVVREYFGQEERKAA